MGAHLIIFYQDNTPGRTAVGYESTHTRRKFKRWKFTVVLGIISARLNVLWGSLPQKDFNFGIFPIWNRISTVLKYYREVGLYSPRCSDAWLPRRWPVLKMAARQRNKESPRPRREARLGTKANSRVGRVFPSAGARLWALLTKTCTHALREELKWTRRESYHVLGLEGIIVRIPVWKIWEVDRKYVFK